MSAQQGGHGTAMVWRYLDPPYRGCAHLYPEKTEVDHRALIVTANADLAAGRIDGWALSCKADAGELAELITWAEADGTPVRLLPWCKPFGIYKPNVPRAWVHEYVLIKGGREMTREDPTVRDFIIANVTLERGLVGAKPEEFCWHLFDWWNAKPGDVLEDAYPGSGAVTAAWDAYFRKGRWNAKPKPDATVQTQLGVVA